MKKLVISACVAVACLVATTCKAQAEEPTPFDNYVVRSAEMTYFYGACSTYARADQVADFRAIFDGWREGSPLQREAFRVLEQNWREGLADARTLRFTRGECWRLIVDTSNDWLEAAEALKAHHDQT